jgi:hypothetical protein
MKIKRRSKNHVLFNENGEHIDGYLIHLNKNKTKWKSKTTQNWSKSNGISKCVCPRIWVSSYVFKKLDKN